MSISQNQDTIVALATVPGVSAIAVIRLSGEGCISICNDVFYGGNLEEAKANTIHFGTIREDDKIVDEVLVSVFRAPRSFTKENSVEISTHGSPFIVKKVMQLLVKKGARMAGPGEFTKRAFLHGQFDLAQAEAVADLIHSDSEKAHEAALNQMRGGFSNEIAALREQLIHFASMIELELDFGEEDVEFADRDQLIDLIEKILVVVRKLRASFDFGNVIKEGVPTVIAGKPNAGKSTLLNALLKEDRAIVSDIAGTTRDAIEDELIIDGVKFRFIDTAGLRETEDTIEAIGVEKTKEKIAQASLVLYLFDASSTTVEELNKEIEPITESGKPYLLLANKIDKAADLKVFDTFENMLFISASEKENLEALELELLKAVQLDNFKTGDTVVTNLRHFESLLHTQESLEKTIDGVNIGVSGDFLAMDIRQALHFLGEISGEVTTDDLLENIFSKFCIGK